VVARGFGLDVLMRFLLGALAGEILH
jgi:hypothetical protein